MGIQICLDNQIRLLVLADVMVEKGDRDDERNQTLAIIRDYFE
jgi:hypothetical protein